MDKCLPESTAGHIMLKVAIYFTSKIEPPTGKATSGDIYIDIDDEVFGNVKLTFRFLTPTKYAVTNILTGDVYISFEYDEEQLEDDVVNIKNMNVNIAGGNMDEKWSMFVMKLM